MANILSLALKVNADASGVVKNLTPAERALQKLSGEADKVAKVFDEFARTSEAAARTQDGLNAKFAELSRLLDSKQLSPQEFASQWAELQAEVKDTAAAYAEGARITESVRTAEERRADTLARLSDLLELGAISEQTYARAKSQASGAVSEDLANAERERAQAMAAASRIIQANLTPQERYDRQLQELSDHLREGRLTQEQFNRAAAKAEQDLNGVAKEATKADDKIDRLSRNVGILARIEIGRLFVDGLQSLGNVFQDIGSRVTSLVTSVNGSIDTLNDFSARTGIGVEELQGYSLAAKLAGVDTEQFGAAVQRLAVNIGKATPGDALDKSLRGINLSVQELRALSPEEQFSAIGQAISELPTAADRAAAAVEIFGKQGAALAPLFREGAASIEELQAKAERLGIIVSETQVNNVADMNDAFDLVRATIEGIIGQVIGNLAPAVTEVTNQFLQFVESWSGAQGEGGTGIANAITDVLLQGAEYFAGIFDSFVENFSSLGETFSYAADIFDVVSKVLLTASEGLRAAFNAIQIGIDGLLIGFGKIIESIGSYISSDLEQFGAGLAAASQESAEKNSREMEAAAANAANTFNSIFAGGNGNAESAGQGAAQQYLRGLRGEIENARLPEVQLQTNVDTLRERFDGFFNGIVDHSSEVTAAMREFEALLAAAQQDGELTAEEIANIEEAQGRVNDLIDQEIAARQESAAAAAAQAEADQKRIDSLLGASDASAKLEQDLQAVQREQARVSEELAAARAADNQTQAEAAVARQEELDQLQAKLEEQQQALEQGFGQGFQAAFANVNQSIDGLIGKSQQFGQAGFDAALRLQEGIANAQQQAKDGILNAEAFNAEVERQKALFEQELNNIEEAENARDKAAQDRLSKEKARQEAELKAQEDYRKQQESALQAYQQQQKQAQEAYAKEQQKIFEEQRKAAEAEAKRQEERLRKLNTLGQQSIAVSDVRNAEGANLVLQLAAGAQDPRLIQERMQTKLLEQIALGIGQAASNYFRTPVAIVGAADVGGI